MGKKWFKLGEKFNIQFTSEIIKDITMCIFSISQFTEYQSKDELYFGKFEIMKSENALFLCATEGKPKSLYIIFFNLIMDPSKQIEEEDFHLVIGPVEVLRINGKLELKEVKIKG